MGRKSALAPLTAKQHASLKILGKALKAERTAAKAAKMWGEESRQRLYKPRKQLISLRVEADVLAWLKKDGKGYQSRANRMLREKMLADKAS